jgi:hypothetical protein
MKVKLFTLLIIVIIFCGCSNSNRYQFVSSSDNNPPKQYLLDKKTGTVWVLLTGTNGFVWFNLGTPPMEAKNKDNHFEIKTN